jgi:hypothetical protein
MRLEMVPPLSRGTAWIEVVATRGNRLRSAPRCRSLAVISGGTIRSLAPCRMPAAGDPAVQLPACRMPGPAFVIRGYQPGRSWVSAIFCWSHQANHPW